MKEFAAVSCARPAGGVIWMSSAVCGATMVALHTGLPATTVQPWPAGHAAVPPAQEPAWHAWPVMQAPAVLQAVLFARLANEQEKVLAVSELQVPVEAWHGLLDCAHVWLPAAAAVQTPVTHWSIVQPLLSALQDVPFDSAV